MKVSFLPIFTTLVALCLTQISAHPAPNPVAPATEPLPTMPVPASVTRGDGGLKIDESFRAAMTGFSEPRLQRALTRFLERLQKRTGIRLVLEPVQEPEQAQFVMHCGGPGEPVQSVNADESYSIEVSPSKARLAAPSPLGILHGLETLLQLVEIGADSFALPAVSIQDRPRFAWRGLMIDASRHWQPVEAILRNLDGMAAVKLNVFHWHLSDDQGFRVESKKFPKLHQLGSDGQYYTQAQLREVVAYARERGIRVVPEFDMPAHTTAWFPGYPRLASGPGPYKIERKWGVFDPVMDPSKEEVYSFLNSFISEIAPLFPDQYWHIGGDEVNNRQWNASASLAAFKKKNNFKTNGELHNYFNKRLIAILAKHGKKTIGWDEILNPDLPKNAVIQSWRGQDYLAQGAEKGYSGILSAGYYLDHLRSAEFHYKVDPLGQKSSSLTDAQKSLILGGEACMWGEYLTSENLDSRIWPRAAAVAERLWSPAEVKDIDDMYRRMAIVSQGLESLGLTHRSSYLSMLDRMAGGQAPKPLKTLGDIVESVKTLGRGRLRSYTSLTPMNRLTDAVPPESDAAREFNRTVDLALANPADLQARAAELRSRLIRWRDNHPLLSPLLQNSFLLRELAPLSQNASAVASTGLQALEYLEFGRKPAESWSREQADFLKRMERPEAECLIMIVPGVRKLVTAAGQLP